MIGHFGFKFKFNVLNLHGKLFVCISLLLYSFIMIYYGVLMEFQVLIKNWTNQSREAIPIRFEVFVKEQNVPEEIEIDEDDAIAWHALAYKDSSAIGTARLVLEAYDDNSNVGKIGRMAVLKKFRSYGVGTELIKALIQFGVDMGLKEFYLNAQLSAQGFYRNFGFIPEGEIFEDAGILHQTMRLKI